MPFFIFFIIFFIIFLYFCKYQNTYFFYWPTSTAFLIKSCFSCSSTNAKQKFCGVPHLLHMFVLFFFVNVRLMMFGSISLKGKEREKHGERQRERLIYLPFIYPFTYLSLYQYMYWYIRYLFVFVEISN